MKQFDLDTFFDEIEPLFRPRGGLTDSRRDGMVAIFNAWDKFPSNQDRRHLAYCLATTFHETGFTMEPVKERGGRDYYLRLYDIVGDNPARARKMGNTKAGDGAKYCGRGYVQLTWKSNYEKCEILTGVPLLTYPERAMEPDVAATIMFYGMWSGLFTGRKLSHYIRGAKADYTQARRIINGMDKASDIAAYARKFQSALLAAATEDPETPPGKPAMLSTTNIAAGAVGLSGTVATVNAVRDGVNQVKDVATTITDSVNSASGVAVHAKGMLPWLGLNTTTLSLGLGVLTILLAGYIIRERVVKARDLGV